ncbi:Ig-like domain-containing protein [Nocardia sp. NPDC056000]|uniref:Ig-like domain-containing protein n=1 Tax=Nocardia sp. NPDC056000 TaxID=3345674 RepID=UPI0035E07254
MISVHSRTRRFATATFLALATSALLAPQAFAKVDNVKAPEDVAKYPCAFHCQITAQLSGADANAPVTFSVNGQKIGTATPAAEKDGDKGKLTASIEWAAPGNGEYVITATQGSGDKSTTYKLDVDVSKTSKKSG